MTGVGAAVGEGSTRLTAPLTYSTVASLRRQPNRPSVQLRLLCSSAIANVQLVQPEPAIADTAPPGMTPNAEDLAVFTT